MLSSMWLNKAQVLEFTEPQPFLQFLDSDQDDDQYISALTKDWVEAHYNLVTDDVLPMVNLNVCLSFSRTRALLQHRLDDLHPLA